MTAVAAAAAAAAVVTATALTMDPSMGVKFP
jgi:hypothetical protein